MEFYQKHLFVKIFIDNQEEDYLQSYEEILKENN